MKLVFIFSCISALFLSVNGLPTLGLKIGPTSHRVWRPPRCETIPFHVSSGSQTFYRFVENTDSCVPFQADQLPNWYGYETKQQCDLECRNIISRPDPDPPKNDEGGAKVEPTDDYDSGEEVYDEYTDSRV
ncbi:uncharacterized protein LOC106659648 [Trichogramma pretiosum]|uniref:uncharacterized protein LOC106659648 n=1 Tax=Trichogramma pretiosum TaxID=7493 RepID=UPI0006C988DB|nr:uncharacterized protein LOC106659648 [Trichogramma pretiosum]